MVWSNSNKEVTVMSKDLPPLLRYLRDEQNMNTRIGQPVLGHDLFFLDLSDWKLRLSERTPIIWIKASVYESNTPQHLVESLQDVMNNLQSRRDPLIALIEGDCKPLQKYNFNLFKTIVYLGNAEQEMILRSQRPSATLRELIASQLPVSLLAPYETAAHVTGSRFFGREVEVRRIINNPETNFLVLGIRRI